LTASGCEGPVEPNQFCDATFEFAPTFARSPDSGDFRIGAAGSTVVVPYTLRFTPLAPEPTVPTEINFGDVRDGTTATQRLTLRNFYVDRADVTSVSFSPGSRFAVSSTTCAPFVESGRSCDINMTYTPGTHVGPDTDALTITGPWGAGGAMSTETFIARATGVASPIISAVPSSLHFPTMQQVGTTSDPQAVVVTNVGSAPLDLSVVVGGVPTEFQASGCDGATLAPNDQCTIAVAFAPQSHEITPRDAVLALNDRRIFGVTAGVELTTNYVLPLGFDPATVTFPDTRMRSTSAPMTITVKNWNVGETRIDKVAMLDPFDYTLVRTDCERALPSGGTCEIVATFHPTATGDNNRGDVLIVLEFQGQSVQERIPLRGIGLDPATNRPPTAGDDAGNVRAGATVTIDPRRNDSDPDAGATLSAPVIVTAPSIGSATVAADGTIVYLAPRNVASRTVVTIVYSVCDEQGACSTATIRITITRLVGTLPATGSETPWLALLAAVLGLAGVVARRIARR
jgi:LPXTG-motif cell wall-anchored protein